MANTASLIQPACPPSRLDMFALYSSHRSNYISFPNHQRVPVNPRRTSLLHTRCSTKPGIDSNNATSTAIELDSSSMAQHLATPRSNTTNTPSKLKGLVFDLGPTNSWDSTEIGSPIVKRYIGDNEERWFMWYHGNSDTDKTDRIGLAVSSNGVNWIRGSENEMSCADDVGVVMNCSKNWWAFDTESIRPSELVIMSSQMYSSVYWLYYTGFSSEEVEIPGFSTEIFDNPEGVNSENTEDGNRQIGKIFKSLPGLACSQDGRHWARIEGDLHSGALLDVGSGKEWDSLFIGAPHVVVHKNDDLRMYYHSFDQENGAFALGVARSRDGIRWVKLGKILERGKKGAFDELGVKNACVVRSRKDGKYLMAYEGVAANGVRSIGLAVSSDGLKNWERLQEDPILEPETEEEWDNKGVRSPCLIQMEDKVDEWRLYYVGVGGGGRTGIGMAVSEGSNIGNFRRCSGLVG
ncbi:Arabinanase/levansucrase/invertase [Euphorbia peplus]|nr:Arabinanase/levansucrase/invertase [Euphorbia peplus]